VLINLAANAVSSPRRAACGSRARRPDRTLRFDVEDTGPGIPREDREIFRPFTQVDASMSRARRNRPGSRHFDRLARALGGELWSTARSAGQPVHAADRTLAEASGHLTPSLARATRSASRLHGRVLIAEDGADNRRLLAHLLERWGLEVEIAENGAQALDRVASCAERAEPVELVLMDMQMPEVDGYEAARTLRARGFQGPIIALTAHAMEGSREVCTPRAATTSTKPVDRAAARRARGHFGGPTGPLPRPRRARRAPRRPSA
jgi:CheY-like chemotaxis protein